ncbi:MAG: NAD(P)-binding protein [Candidatus Puniceispirillales bacterium]
MPQDMSKPGSTRYDILFEPMKIGPVTAKNRFYQVPHCNGGGYRDPSAVAEMRRTKAEGGWGVIYTEQVEIHQTSEITPFIELRLWEDKDMPMMAKMAEAIKSHDALAGIELAYSGINGPNLYTKEVPLAPTGGPIITFTADPVNARSLSKEEIKDVRRWYVNAAKRSRDCGYDLICLYGAHGFGIIQHFLSRTTNKRDDEYGGSLENRSRFLREVITDIREAVGDTMGVTVRLSLDEAFDELSFSNSELRDCIEMHADLPDLWDLAHGTWEDCSGTSRFKDEGAQEDLIKGIKELTPKPVVGVGRFTSPDAMVRQIKSGILDFIGAARPSIADPFLPNKVKENRIEDIRECIGCNMCVTGDMTMSISRCTQNPSFMEEWRKGWHPEHKPAKGESQSVLVIGSGPAGLEAARMLGGRGYDVAIAEAKSDLGGRVARERLLPNLSAWGRVMDYRLGQIEPLPNVSIYRESHLTADDVMAFGFEHVCVATGSTWRRDGTARAHLRPIPISTAMPLFTPDDIMDGKLPSGHVIVYDDDHYYMGGIMAELLREKGCEVTLVTPSNCVSEWTVNTLEQGFIQARLIDKGIKIRTTRRINAVHDDHVTAGCSYSGREEDLAADAVVMVTARDGNDELWHALRARSDEWADAGIKSIKVIGDAEAPAPIAWATYAGHRYAMEMDTPPHGDEPCFRREVAGLEN